MTAKTHNLSKNSRHPKKIAVLSSRMFSSLAEKVSPVSKPTTSSTAIIVSKKACSKNLDHDKKVKKGLDQIDGVEAEIDKKDNDGKLTKAQAEQVAATVKRNNPIFSKILVHYKVAKNRIDYEWFVSNGIRTSSRKPYTDG